MIGAELGGIPGMATASGIQDISEGKDWQERAKSAVGAAGRTAIYGKAVGQTEKLLGKAVGPTISRYATPTLIGGVEAARSHAYGAPPEKALAQGIVSGGLAATQTSRGEAKEAKPAEAATPKTEAPPAVRKEPPVSEIPKEDLQGAYASEIEKYQDLRPRNERAQTGLQDARAILKQHQAELEALQLSPTPPDPGAEKETQQKLAKQQSHLKGLETQAGKIGDEYRQSRERLMEIRDRAVSEKAKWFIPEPPSARRPSAEPKQIGAGTAVATQPKPSIIQTPISAGPPSESRARPPYQQPGQPQARVGAGQEPLGLPPSTQPFEMMGAQPPLPRGRRIEAGEQPAAKQAEQVSAPAGPRKKEEPPKKELSAEALYRKEAEAGRMAPPKPRAAAKTSEPPKPRRGAKAAPTKAEARPLTAGTRYVVKDTNPDLGLYKGETVIYRGPYGGKYGFDVIDPDTGKKSLMQIESSTPMADIVSNLEEEGEKKKRPGDKHIGNTY